MSVRYYNYNLHNTAESAGGVDGASVRAGLRAATCWSEHSTVTVIVTPLRFVTETRAWL